ncbi:MAG TPA: SIS domain-containing protein [Streptosporangiaceae bacterium]|nr:SIS domain-containing protein [Streptosporangiaceae bacterium]
MSDDDPWDGAEFALAEDRLDMPDVIAAADPSEMLRQVASAAAQVRTAERRCAEADMSGFGPESRPRAVIVAGMGGSGTAGDILAAVCGPGSPVQVITVRSARLPGWVGAADLVLAVSASGGTAETLTVAAEAGRRGCRLVCVGAEGSPLHRIAEQAKAAFIPVATEMNAQQVLPRQSLWSLTVPLLVVADRLGIASIGQDGYEQTARRLEEVAHQCRPSSESFVNPGKSLALDLAGSLPLLWGVSPLSGVAAARFACQLNENAKYPALVGVIPEVLHNQLGAFDGPFVPGPESLDVTSGFTPLRLVLINDGRGRDTESIADLAAHRGIGVSELALAGEHPLDRLAAVIQLADYASVYLAIASGVDPGQPSAIRDMPAPTE